MASLNGKAKKDKPERRVVALFVVSYFDVNWEELEHLRMGQCTALEASTALLEFASYCSQRAAGTAPKIHALFGVVAVTVSADHG